MIELGESHVIDLIENGREVTVTRANVVRYIHLIANYRLNVSIKHQCDAFMRGFEAAVDPAWLKMFSPVCPLHSN